MQPVNVDRGSKRSENHGELTDDCTKNFEHALAHMNWSGLLPAGNLPLFYPIDRHGLIGSNRLRPDAVSVILRNQLHRARLSPHDFSGLSIRAGLVTSAFRAGVSAYKVRQQTGHASDAMLERYIRDARLFDGNAAGELL